MKRLALSIIAAACVAGCADMQHHAAATESASPKEMKVAFDVTNGNPQVVMLTLKVIDVTRKQLIDAGMTPRIVIAFRGDASYFTQDSLAVVKEADRAQALQVKAMIRELKKANGVEGFEQCNIPLASRKLNPRDLMPEVKLVPNGWIALAEYQHKGYSYIVP